MKKIASVGILLIWIGILIFVQITWFPYSYALAGHARVEDVIIRTLNNDLECTNYNLDEPSGVLPDYYDRRIEGNDILVKNQGKDGSCWAYAAIAAIENNLLNQEQKQFSVDDLLSASGYTKHKWNSGSYIMAIAYLNSWEGPVEEKNPENFVAKHVQEMQIIPSKDYRQIKEMVYRFGTVQSSIYMEDVEENNMTSYYNRKTYTYYVNDTHKPNHDIVIIGWDDNFSKSKFLIEPENDGAFICLNSWGDSFGDKGFFYISYDDTNIGTVNAVYSDLEDINNYKRIYQSDKYGWVGQLGFQNENAYFANVFTSEKTEKLKAVGFYATGPGTSYELYVITNYKNQQSFLRKKYVTKGYLKNAGYYTIPVNSIQKLKKGKKFAVIVKIHTPNKMEPVAAEFRTSYYGTDAVLSDGEGYMSLYGTTWKRTESTQKSNICLKAYTD